MIVLALDWGRKRTGVAVSDAMGLLAHPVSTLEEEAPSKLAGAVSALARARGAEKILIGLPLNMDGTEGDSAQAVHHLAGILRESFGHNVELWDERLTSWEAERALAGKGAAKRKASRDMLAACLILQSYLDKQRPG